MDHKVSGDRLGTWFDIHSIVAFLWNSYIWTVTVCHCAVLIH